MWIPIRNKKTLGAAFVIFAGLVALTLSIASCNKTGTTSAGSKEIQRTFATPADASAAFVQAAESGDQAALLAIFGPDAKDDLFSGDPVKDKDNLQDFVAAYNQMHRWREIKAGAEILYTGEDNYPFPIPLAQNHSGKWSFDSEAGKDEILARRIGKDELTAIAGCNGIADAEHQYFSEKHDGDKAGQYAQKFVSDNGTQNGLYWFTPQRARGQPSAPSKSSVTLPRLRDTIRPGDKPQPYNGYYYHRILTKQGDKAPGGAKDYIVNGKMTGGFAALAFPAEYRNSGIMTFMIGTDGIVYQKDLGEGTTEAAAALTEYNPGDGWNPAI